MKKLSFAIIIALFSIGVTACTNSAGTNTGTNAGTNVGTNTSTNAGTNTGTNTRTNVGTNAGTNTSTNTGTNASTNTSVNNKITIEKAKEIALKHAGLTNAQVSFIRAERDIDDGIDKYDVEFNYNGKEYNYEISAIDGKIIKYDQEIEYANSQNNVATNTQGSTQNNATNSTSNNTNSTANISADKAKQIALSHAGLTSSQVTFKRTELDFDDGISKYEVEFYYNNREYSYEINAKTGAILSYEQD